MALQKNVLEYLERSARLYPDKIAFADEREALTFGALKTKAESLGTRIAGICPRINRPIAVLVDRSVAGIVGFMAVLYSGNYYVPLDNQMPAKRMEAILSRLEPELLLHSAADGSLAAKFARLCPVADIGEAEGGEADLGLLALRRRAVLDIDPVYVIFTSGSTGTPKGIVISHRSAIDFIEWMADTFHFSSADIMGNQAPFHFDLSVKDIYMTLQCGGTMHILPRKQLMFPPLLIESLREKRVTALIWATSAFNLVANAGILSVLAPDTVNKVILGGEALRAKQLNIWRAALPDVQYVNLYGPTEVTVDCTYYIIDRPYQDHEAIPIGRACENMEVMLLDENLRPVPPGQPGEICARGSGLARGYFGDAAKTAAAFVQNPCITQYPDLIYRTGDTGLVNEEGLIVYLSRKDGQIKHMGYRIELGELEHALAGLARLRAAVCFFDEKRDKIVCVYEGDLENKEIIEGLRPLLPKYMFPNIMRRVEKMPYNANGKIDRVLLKEKYFHETD